MLIVNREESTKAANPGIESLWEDERTRRSLMDSENIPSLEPPTTQPREYLVTKSDIYFKKQLLEKLSQKNETTLNQTSLADSSSNDTINTQSTESKVKRQIDYID